MTGTDRVTTSIWFGIAAIVVVTSAAYAPVFNNGFVNFDDNLYVTANPQVQEGISLGGVEWAFTTSFAANWHPVTWLSHMLDFQLFGTNPAGHHAVSLVLHIANAVLLFLFLSAATGSKNKSLFVAILFAIHPFHVESVAWISERKDMLSTFFGLLALLSWLRFTKTKRYGAYALILMTYALSLMAKPMLVTLPVLMLTLDYWPLQRLHLPDDAHGSAKTNLNLVAEKLPLVFLAGVSSVITIVVQRTGGAVGSLEQFPLIVRIANAAVSCLAYLTKTFVPRNLAVFYPHPEALPSYPILILALVLPIAITILVCVFRNRAPYALQGWLWFLIALSPVIGIIQIGEQAYADRYTYVPLIGIFVALAWSIASLIRVPKVSVALATIAVLALSFLTFRQAATWKNSITLWAHAVASTSNNYMAHIKLGNALAAANKNVEAEQNFNEAIRIRPGDDDPCVNLAALRLKQNRIQDAVQLLQKAIEIRPNSPLALVNLGIALASQNRIDEAIPCFESALKINPNMQDAHFNLATAYYTQGKYDLAAKHFAEAVRLSPLDVNAQFGLAASLVGQGKIAGARPHLQEVLRRHPNHTEARELLKRIDARSPSGQLQPPLI